MTAQTFSGFRQIADIVFPWSLVDRRSAQTPPLRWALHLAFWSSLAFALWCLNRWGGLDRVLQSPWPILHRVWLPSLAILAYALTWLSFGLWMALLSQPKDGVPAKFDVAWIEARRALEESATDWTDMPLFLVLGPLNQGPAELLDSVGAAALSQPAGSPFQVFRRPDAIFVACNERPRTARLDSTQQPPLQAETEESSLYSLCKLLMRDRSQDRPIQGIVVSVPLAMTQSDGRLKSAIRVCRRDLTVIRETTGLEVPIYFAVGGVDAVPPLPASASSQQFSPLPDLDPAEVVAMYKEGIDSLCLAELPRYLRSLLECGEAAADANARIYLTLSALLTGRTRLQTLILEGTLNDYSEPGMVAGCYFLSSASSPSEAAQALGRDLLEHRHVAVRAGSLAA